MKIGSQKLFSDDVLNAFITFLNCRKATCFNPEFVYCYNASVNYTYLYRTCMLVNHHICNRTVIII